MSARAILFLGPTLAAAEARIIDPDVLVLPPAGMGDLVSAVRHYRPKAVGLIDGTFKQNLSVFHKEILYVLAQGVWVIGASSMGALRACEMDRYGMVGVGQIYDGYASGVLCDDDEVALVHAGPEFDHQALSDPMVNIRATLDRAVEIGALDVAQASGLADAQKARFYPERRLAHLLDDARRIIDLEPKQLDAFTELVQAGGVNAKAADARLAVAEVRARSRALMPESMRPEMTMSATFEATLQRDVVVGQDADLPVTFDALRRHSALNDPNFESTRRHATSLAVIERLAAISGIEAEEIDRAEALQLVVDRLGLMNQDDHETLHQLDMTTVDLDRMVATEAIFIRMQRWLRSTNGATRGTQFYIDELRREGRYVDTRTRAGLFERLAGTSASDGVLPSLQRLMELQAAMTDWQVPEDLDDYIETHELGNRAEFYDRLWVSVVALHEVAGVALDPGSDAEDPGTLGSSPIRTRGTM